MKPTDEPRMKNRFVNLGCLFELSLLQINKAWEEAVPEEYRDEAKLQYDVYSDNEVLFYVTWRSLETEEEVQQRLSYAEAVKADKMRRYERLKKELFPEENT